MNEIPKVVFSKTLERADWPETRIARGDLAKEIARLKREPGNDLIAYGGASLDQGLSRLGVVDEYRLMVEPAGLGAGLPPVQGSVRPASPRARRSDDVFHGRRNSRLPTALGPRRSERLAEAVKAVRAASRALLRAPKLDVRKRSCAETAPARVVRCLSVHRPQSWESARLFHLRLRARASRCYRLADTTLQCLRGCSSVG
jgi:hypothetical protein